MRPVTRAQSNLREPTSVTRIGGSLGIFGHWTAGPPGQSVRQIQDYHMNVKRWTDIAYSWLVDTNGTIYEGRGWGRAGGHTQGYNSTSHACCAIAGEDGQVTDAQLLGMAEVFREHDRIYGGGFHLPHRAVGATACPGDKIAAWIAMGDFGDTGELFDMDALKQIAGFHHDTRKLVLRGHIEDRKEHAKTMRAIWKSRREAREFAGQAIDLLTVEDHVLLKAVEDAEFLIAEGERQLAELDADG